VSVLNDIDILINASLDGFLGEISEKWLEFSKLSNLGELMLEIFPDMM